MDTVVVLVIVLSAVAFIGRRIFMSVRSARAAKAGCADCGCGSGADSRTDWSKS